MLSCILAVRQRTASSLSLFNHRWRHFTLGRMDFILGQVASLLVKAKKSGAVTLVSL